MKKLFMAALAVATIAMVGCKKTEKADYLKNLDGYWVAETVTDPLTALSLEVEGTAATLNSTVTDGNSETNTGILSYDATTGEGTITFEEQPAEYVVTVASINGDQKNIKLTIKEGENVAFEGILVKSQKPDEEEVVAPTAADLKDYIEDGKLVVCVKFEEQVCNDVVFAGSYNGWSTDDPSTMAHFEALEGFEGWYVVAVTDESEEIQGKPVQLCADGSFSWDYQTGDADSWTLVSGTVTISAGYSGESDLKGYSTAEPVILISKYFKNHNTPCGEAKPKHDYTVYVKVPSCGDYAPAIIGDFNSWADGVAMELQEDGSYKATINDEEGHGFKFRQAGISDWSNQIQEKSIDSETNEETWKDASNVVLGAETTITLDYSDAAKYKWTLCE